VSTLRKNQPVLVLSGGVEPSVVNAQRRYREPIFQTEVTEKADGFVLATVLTSAVLAAFFVFLGLVL
jgi:hypothetical protein